MERKPNCIVAPSMLSADFSQAGKAVEMIGKTTSQWIHLDVMDGMFVPNISFGPKFIQDIRELSKLVFDTHLMVEQPERYIPLFAAAGSDYITVHAEASVHLNRTLAMITDEGKKSGVSIVPSTPVSAIEMVLDEVDLVLVMSVNPGFGGQKFIPSSLEKIRQLDTIRRERGLDFKISVDGGVGLANGKMLIDSGVDVLVMGSAFFGSSDKQALVAKLQGLDN
jgi:ribulose-phosphate 3-epimerase